LKKTTSERTIQYYRL